MLRKAAVIGLCLTLNGCWFVYVPGSLVGSISDSFTGAEGSHCVGASAKVGDRIRLPGGGHGTVVSLSGTSARCTQDAYPIRAMLQLDP
jgi:hypothetical protein